MPMTPSQNLALLWQTDNVRETMYLEANMHDGSLPSTIAEEWAANRRLGATDTSEVTSWILDGGPFEVAQAWDAPYIPNGEYTVNVPGNCFEYKVYLVRGGQLAGKRILKYKGRDGVFRGFAFLTRTGELKLWQRFAEEESAEHVVIARDMLTTVRIHNASDSLVTIARQERYEMPLTFSYVASDSFGRPDNIPATLNILHTCWQCNEHGISGAAIRRCGAHPALVPEPTEEELNRPFFEVVGRATFAAHAGEVVDVALTPDVSIPGTRTRRTPRSGSPRRTAASSEASGPPLSETGDGTIQ